MLLHRDVDDEITTVDHETNVDRLAELYTHPPWMADALCREYPIEWWFPKRGESTARAVAVCERCLVRRECAAFASRLGSTVTIGVWAGTSGRDRRALAAAPTQSETFHDAGRPGTLTS